MSSSVFYFTGGKMKQKELYKTSIYYRLSLDDESMVIHQVFIHKRCY